MLFVEKNKFCKKQSSCTQSKLPKAGYTRMQILLSGFSEEFVQQRLVCKLTLFTKIE